MKISIFKWIRLIRGLRKRGAGHRESGAFLVAPAGSQKIVRIVFYDEIDPHAFDSGIIELRGIAHVQLNKILGEIGGTVIADIHTHPPGCPTAQSTSDKMHPMCRITGHIAFIAPDYAINRLMKPTDCGAYKYQGQFKWQTLNEGDFPLRITLL